jgi:outer membrane protein assembly factor BamB
MLVRSRTLKLLMTRLLRLLSAAFVCSAGAENWPRFRGPTGQGLSSERDLPIQWSAEQNVKWKTAIHGEGWSSPIIWGDRVYVTTVTDANTRARVISLDRATGEVLWDTVVVEIIPLRKERKNSYGSPTPVTDGQRVYAVFGDGTIAAVERDGRVAWTNQEVRYYSRHGLGASPILHEGVLIMPFDGSNRIQTPGDWPKNSDEERLGWQIPWDKAEIVALDVQTGRRAWTGRRGRSRIAHVTPNILVEHGRAQLISCAGDAIQGFDPRTGELQWTVYSRGEGVTPSFAMGDGLIFTSSGFEATTLRAVRTGGKGDVTSTHIAWEQRKGVPTQPSLLYVSPYLHSVTDGGIAHCFAGNTGEMVYSERVGGNHCASPVYADGKIYFLSETGETTVIAAGPEFKILARNPVNETCQASLGISQGNIFLRTASHLYCIGP